MIEFINSFLSYLLLFGIMAVIAGLGIFAGTALRKKKNAEQAKNETAEQ